MPIILSDTKKNLSNSINNNNTIRSIFGNPIILSLIIIIIILCIFTIQIYNTSDEVTVGKQSKLIIYSYIVILISIIMNNSIILYDCNKELQKDNNNLFDSIPTPEEIKIIPSNITGSGVQKTESLNLPEIEKLDIDEFLN